MNPDSVVSCPHSVRRASGMACEDKNVWNTYNFPPGFRFLPRDEELITEYLMKKIGNRPFPQSIIHEVNIYNHHPDYLSYHFMGFEGEWYFFTPRDKKYPGGSRPDRQAGNGYWKATGSNLPVVVNGTRVGYKRTLVFCLGKTSSNVEKTQWIMHEYTCDRTPTTCAAGPMRLDDWVLCKIHKNKKVYKQNKRKAHHQEITADTNLVDHETVRSAYDNGLVLAAGVNGFYGHGRDQMVPFAEGSYYNTSLVAHRQEAQELTNNIPGQHEIAASSDPPVEQNTMMFGAHYDHQGNSYINYGAGNNNTSSRTDVPAFFGDQYGSDTSMEDLAYIIELLSEDQTVPFPAEITSTSAAAPSDDLQLQNTMMFAADHSIAYNDNNPTAAIFETHTTTTSPARTDVLSNPHDVGIDLPELTNEEYWNHMFQDAYMAT